MRSLFLFNLIRVCPTTFVADTKVLFLRFLQFWKSGIFIENDQFGRVFNEQLVLF